DVGGAARRLECNRLAGTHAEVDELDVAERVAHLPQPGIEGRRQRPPQRWQAERAGGVGQPRSGLPGMTDRLRRVLENLEQPLHPAKVPAREVAPEIAVMGKYQ